MDGKDRFGHIAAALATDVAARKARQTKVAVVSVDVGPCTPAPKTRSTAEQPHSGLTDD